MTGQAQKNSRVQRRLHARAQVHSTVSTRLGIAPIRFGVVVRASATTSPPLRNGKENKKQTNRSRQHSQTILSVTTVHHRLRAHSDKSDCRTRTCARCASCIPIFHIISMPSVPRSLVWYTPPFGSPISLRPPTHPRVLITRMVFLRRRRKSNHRHPRAYKQNNMSCSRRRHHHYYIYHSPIYQTYRFTII